eukprot:453810_1
MFITNSNHICFWDITNNKHYCYCAHRLNIMNWCGILSMGCCFIGSPAQLHIIQINDMLSDINRRMCLTINNNNYFPDQNGKYIMLNNEQKMIEWKQWSNKRVIKEIKKIEFGVVYFLEHKSEFYIIRYDIQNMIKYMKQNKDLNVSFVQIKGLNEGVYQWIDPSGSNGNYNDVFPSILDGIQCKIKLSNDNTLKIVTIYCFKNLLFVMDNKWYLWIYTDFALFIRKIYIGINGENNQNYYDKKQCQIGFDG